MQWQVIDLLWVWEGENENSCHVCDVEIHFIHIATETMCVLAFNCCCNNYKFSGLKHTSVLSYSSWSQNSKMSFMGLKSSCWQGWLMEALEEDPFLPFSSTWGCLHSSARSPSFSIFKTNNRVSLNQCLSFSAFCFHCHISFSWFWSSYLPLIEAFVISLSPPR